MSGVDRVFGTCSEHGPYELPLGSIDHGDIERRCPGCALDQTMADLDAEEFEGGYPWPNL